MIQKMREALGRYMESRVAREVMGGKLVDEQVEKELPEPDRNFPDDKDEYWSDFSDEDFSVEDQEEKQAL